jgi:hypothetical protein
MSRSYTSSPLMRFRGVLWDSFSFQKYVSVILKFVCAYGKLEEQKFILIFSLELLKLGRCNFSSLVLLPGTVTPFKRPLVDTEFKMHDLHYFKTIINYVVSFCIISLKLLKLFHL